MGPTPDKKQSHGAPTAVPETAAAAIAVTDSDSDWESDISSENAGNAPDPVEYEALPTEITQVQADFEWREWTESDTENGRENLDDSTKNENSSENVQNSLEGGNLSSVEPINNLNCGVQPCVSKQFEEALAESSSRHLSDTDFLVDKSVKHSANDIALNDDKIATIKQCMAQMKLPYGNVPTWAQDTSDDNWMQHLEEKLHRKCDKR